MITERCPRQGSYAARVLEQMRKGKVTPEIAGDIDLTNIQVSRAVCRIGQMRYLNRTPKEIKAAKIKAIQISKGSIWSDIEPYARLGMTPLEIQMALSLTSDGFYEYIKIRRAVHKQRERQNLVTQIEDEAYDTRRISFEKHPVQVRERIVLWLEAVAVFIQEGQGVVPRTRTEWLQLIDQHKNDGLLSTHALNWFELNRLYCRNKQQLSLYSSEEEVETERTSITLMRVKEDQLLRDIIGGDKIPNSKLDRSYLIDFFVARKLWSETRDNRLLCNFPTFYEKADCTIIERLRSQRESIIRRTPQRATPFPWAGIAEAGEIRPDEIGLLG